MQSSVIVIIATKSLKNFAVQNCTKELFKYPAFDRLKIEPSFTGGDVSSDTGIMLLD